MSQHERAMLVPLFVNADGNRLLCILSQALLFSIKWLLFLPFSFLITSNIIKMIQVFKPGRLEGEHTEKIREKVLIWIFFSENVQFTEFLLLSEILLLDWHCKLHKYPESQHECNDLKWSHTKVLVLFKGVYEFYQRLQQISVWFVATFTISSTCFIVRLIYRSTQIMYSSKSISTTV